MGKQRTEKTHKQTLFGIYQPEQNQRRPVVFPSCLAFLRDPTASVSLRSFNW